MMPESFLLTPNNALTKIDPSSIDAGIVHAITPVIVWISIILGLLLIIIMTMVLRWHWRKYTLNTHVEKRATKIYFIGIGIGFFTLVSIGVLYTLNYPL